MGELPAGPALVELILGAESSQGGLLCYVTRRRREPRGEGTLVMLQALGHKVPQQPYSHSGCRAALIYRQGGTLWRQPCVLGDTSAFPKLRATLEGRAVAIRREPLAEVEVTFPVRFQIIGSHEATDIGRRFRERLQMQVGASSKAGREHGPAGSMLDNHAELAILSLAKSMVRLDSRFDRLMEKLDKRRRKPVLKGEDRSPASPHEVLIFSLAKMMVTLLDEKFERLLAALRDPDVLARWSKKSSEEAGEEGPPAPHDVMVIQSLARFMDGMGEKFERIVRLLAGKGAVAAALEEAWAVAIGGDMVTLRLAKPLAMDSVLDLELKLPIFPPVPLIAFGRVIGCTEHADEGPEQRFEVRAELIGLDAEDRELLIQFVFRKQREILRARRELHA